MSAPGFDATRVVLGCAPLGGLYGPIADAVADAVVAAAWEHGIRAFDTAPFYGFGLSEERLGHALAGQPRDAYVVMTKVGRRLVPHPPGAPREGGAVFGTARPLAPVRDYSRAGVRRSLEASLERLGVDRLDVVHVHDPDRPEQLDQALVEAFPELVALRDEGVVGAVSAGMNQVAPLVRIVEEADVDCVLVAGRGSLLERGAEPLLELAAARGVRLLAAGVLNSGLLADPRPGARYDYAPVPVDVLARAQALAATCSRHGASLLGAALAYPLRDPRVAAIVVGARAPREVDELVAALAEQRPEALWAELIADG